MLKDKRNQFFAKFALLTVAIVWGSSLVVVKSSTDFIPPNYLLALRFTIACITLCIIFHRKLKLLDKEYFRCGFIIGICLFIAYCSQTIGVIFAMPGKSAFLSSAYCVIVPFLFWIVDHKKPNRYNLMAALFCITGIIAASVSEDFSITKGDSLALLSAFLFAAHIVAVAKYGKGKDPILITILQFGFGAIFSWAVTLLFEEPAKTVWNFSDFGGVLYLSLACTALSLLLQNVGQKYTDPSSASLLLSLESVFGILFSVLFYQETINFRLAFGFALILGAVIISETKLSFFKKLSVCVRKNRGIYNE